MPELDITRLWNTVDLSDETHLENIKDSLETLLNTTKLDADNFQTGGLSTGNLNANAITCVKMGDVNIQSSSAVTISTITATSDTAVGGSGATTVNITSTGRPIVICLISSSTDTTGSSIGITHDTVVAADITLKRDGTEISRTQLNMSFSGGGGQQQIVKVAPSVAWHFDPVVAGSHSYEFFGLVNLIGQTLQFKNVKAIAYEI